MTAPTAPADTRLTALGQSRRLAARTAARLAAELAGKQPWTPVESDNALAARYKISPSTARNAKHLLRELGIITKHRHAWYVKPPAPEPAS